MTHESGDEINRPVNHLASFEYNFIWTAILFLLPIGRQPIVTVDCYLPHATDEAARWRFTACIIKYRKLSITSILHDCSSFWRLLDNFFKTKNNYDHRRSCKLLSGCVFTI